MINSRDSHFADVECGRERVSEAEPKLWGYHSGLIPGFPYSVRVNFAVRPKASDVRPLKKGEAIFTQDVLCRRASDLFSITFEIEPTRQAFEVLSPKVDIQKAFPKMKVLSINFLTCAVKACKSSSNSFPLHPKDAELAQDEIEVNPQFLVNVLPRLDWAALKTTSTEVSWVNLFSPLHSTPFP